MALSYGEIRVWKASDAGKLADGMLDRISAFEDFEESLREAGEWDSWINSIGATMAGQHFMNFRDKVTDAAAEAQALKNTAEQVESALTILHEEVVSLEAFAESALFSIDSTGAVVDLLGAAASLSPAEKAIRQSQELQIRQTVREITLKGQEIEHIAAEGLRAVALGMIDDGGASSVDEAVDSQDAVPTPPGQDAPAVEARVWWDSLSPSQQQYMQRERPDDIRNLWGLPTEVRDGLNRQSLDQEIVDARAEVLELREDIDSYREHLSGSNASFAALTAKQARLDRATHHLATLERTRTAATGPDRHLLEFDLSEDHPEVAISVGDPDTADNVSLTVNGYTTNVHDNIEGKVRDAQHLYDDSRRLSRTENHATVAFLGYQAPQQLNIAGVGTNLLAFEESPKVANAVQGIAVANEKSDVNVSLFGHSYGSTTAGIAAQHLAAEGQSPVDNLAVYGSPGIPEADPDFGSMREVFVDPIYMRDLPDQDALGLDDGRGFFMAEDSDFVADEIAQVGTTNFGLGNPPQQWGLEELPMETTEVAVAVDPASGEPVAFDTRFGLEDHNRITGEDVNPHSIYTKQETISSHNLAAIAAGRLDLVER